MDGLKPKHCGLFELNNRSDGSKKGKEDRAGVNGRDDFLCEDWLRRISASIVSD